MKQVIQSFVVLGIGLLSFLFGVTQDNMSADEEAMGQVREARRESVRPLEIGELCPDFIFDSIINTRITKSKLSDYKGKLVILDFWSTYCSSCIADFPKKDLLQQRFGDQIKVIAVVDQARSLKKLIPTFWSKNKITRQIKLPCILDEDQLLIKYFPRDEIGLQVWIGPDRKLIGITTAEYVTEQNIKAVLSGVKVKFPINRFAKDFDYSQPLPIAPTKSLQVAASSFYTHIGGHITGKDELPVRSNWGFDIDSVKGCKRLFFVNSPIYGVLKTIALNAEQYKFPLMLEVKDSTKYFWNPAVNYYDEWLKNYAISFESVAPLSESDSAMWSTALNTVADYLKASIAVSSKEVNCLVISKAKNIPISALQKPVKDFGQNVVDEYGNIPDPSKAELSNISISGIVSLLNQFYPQYPVVNELENLDKSNVYLDNKKTKDLDMLRKELLGQGLIVELKAKVIKVLVYKDINGD